MTDPILWQQDGAVATITLNRPEMRNSVSDPLLAEQLLAALDRANCDRSVRVVILTGAGSAFCSGGDIRRMQGMLGARREEPVRTPDFYRQGIQRIPLAFERLDVPVIAAVNGPAIGGGLDMACMCDIRIADTRARFASSFVRLGMIPGDGGLWFLQRIVGPSVAAEMALTGEVIDAEAALACGLVSRVVPEGTVLEAARALAARIAANPSHALRMTKRLLLDGRDARLEAHLATASAMQALAHTTAEHAEAVNAFVEKRPAKFA